MPCPPGRHDTVQILRTPQWPSARRTTVTTDLETEIWIKTLELVAIVTMPLITTLELVAMFWFQTYFQVCKNRHRIIESLTSL